MYNKHGKKRLKATWLSKKDVEEPGLSYSEITEKIIESMARKDNNLNRLNKYI